MEAHDKPNYIHYIVSKKSFECDIGLDDNVALGWLTTINDIGDILQYDINNYQIWEQIKI